MAEARAILEAFQSNEILPWQQFEAQHGDLLKESGIFTASEAGQKLWAALKSRIIEHVGGTLQRFEFQ